jgi:hypothetical protein
MRTSNTITNKKNRIEICQLLTELVSASRPQGQVQTSADLGSSDTPVPECEFTVVPFSSKSYFETWLVSGIVIGCLMARLLATNLIYIPFLIEHYL